MKKLSLLSFVAFAFAANAQQAPSDSTKAWSIQGQNSVMLNQASFSNWVGGGANNVGWLASANYNLTYQKDKDLWENIIFLAYGQNDVEGTGNRKTQDALNLSTNYGREIAKSWYASVGASLQTQFAPGYKDGNNPSAAKISSFMAPGYLNTGIGLTYKPTSDFTLTLRPANARVTFVLDKDLQKKGSYGLKNNGDASLFQFGFLANAQYKVKLMDNITLLNTASAFTNYLDHPDHVVLAYGAILNMKVNKYISANITADVLYDHNQILRTQLKQTLGVGFAYNITSGNKPKTDARTSSWKTK